jgi:hypothetical protein
MPIFFGGFFLFRQICKSLRGKEFYHSKKSSWRVSSLQNPVNPVKSSRRAPAEAPCAHGVAPFQGAGNFLGVPFPGVSPLAMELHPFRVRGFLGVPFPGVSPLAMELHPVGVIFHRVFRVPHPNGVLFHSPGQRPGNTSLQNGSRTLKGCNTLAAFAIRTS